MKEYILDQLKEKYEGVSVSLLSRIAEKAAKGITTQEAADEALKAWTFAKVIEYESDRRAAEAAATARAKYENKQKDEPNGKAQPASDDLKGGDNMPAWAKELTEQNRKLSETIAQMTAKSVADARKARIEEATKQLTPLMRAQYAKLSFTGTDEEFETYMTDLSKEVEGIATESKSHGVTFGTPKNGNTDKAQTLSKEQIAAITGEGDSNGKQPF